MASKHDRLSEILLRIWELTRRHAHDTFQDAALAVVREYLPFDGALWGYASVGGAVLKTHAVHLVDVPRHAMDEYERVKDADPVAREAIGRPGRSAAFQAGPRRARFDPAWLAFNRRWGVHAISTVMLVQEVARLAMFSSFYRIETTGPFTAGERRLHEALVPHLASAYRMARIRGIEQDCTRGGPSTLAAITDALGRLHLAEGGFEQLLRKEWQDWQGPALPEPLVTLVPGGGVFRGSALTVSAVPPVEGFTTLWARPLGGVDLLSARELAVARAWASGRSADEIAVELGLSPHTVRNRIRDVYEKLGVQGRTGVAAVLREVSSI